MTGEDLLEALEEFLTDHKITSRQFAWQDIEASLIEELKAELTDYTCVFGPERTEGSGDYDGAQAVFHFPTYDTYISVEGSYASEDGCDFGYASYCLVRPVQITSTYYQPLPTKKSQAW